MLYKKLWSFGLVLAVPFMPPAALAAEAGLPQLDISTWPSQLFWLTVLFGASYVLMAKIVTPRIGKVLEERRTRIDDNLGKARSASDDAARTRAKYEQDLDTARNAAAEAAKQATTQATKEAEATNAKITKKLAEKVAKAEARLAITRDEALASLNDVAAEAAMAAVANLTGIKVTMAEASKTANKIMGNRSKQEVR